MNKETTILIFNIIFTLREHIIIVIHHKNDDGGIPLVDGFVAAREEETGSQNRCRGVRLKPVSIIAAHLTRSLTTDGPMTGQPQQRAGGLRADAPAFVPATTTVPPPPAVAHRKDGLATVTVTANAGSDRKGRSTAGRPSRRTRRDGSDSADAGSDRRGGGTTRGGAGSHDDASNGEPGGRSHNHRLRKRLGRRPHAPPCDNGGGGSGGKAPTARADGTAEKGSSHLRRSDPRKQRNVLCVDEAGDPAPAPEDDVPLRKSSPLEEFPSLASVTADGTDTSTSLSTCVPDYRRPQTSWWKPECPVLLSIRERHPSPNGHYDGKMTLGGVDSTNEAWLSGLDKLTGPSPVPAENWKIRRSRRPGSEFAAWEGDTGPPNGAGTADASRPPTFVAQNRPRSEIGDREFAMRRPRAINIDRLRDRWWDIMAQRNRRRAFLEELKRELVRFRREEDVLPNRNHLKENGRQERGATPTAEGSLPSGHLVTTDDRNVGDARVKPCSPGRTVSSLDHPVDRPKSPSSSFDALEHIIDSNDCNALREFLMGAVDDRWSVGQDVSLSSCKTTTKEMVHDGDSRRRGDTLVQYAVAATVKHNKPQLLQVILSAMGDLEIESLLSQPNPLMQAAEMGHEECLSILLASQDRGPIGLLSLKDGNGDNVLHYCCRGVGNESTLRLLLKQVAGSSKGKQQQLSKIVLARNEQLQTPLHVASQSGRVDFVEVFLTTCSSFLLSKLLAMEDHKKQTPLLAAVANNASDVVVSLIMWRGNHSHAPTKAPVYYSVDTLACIEQSPQANSATSQASCCPLVWAAKSANLDMIELLLQFGDQSGSSYSIPEALPALLLADAPAEVKIEGCEILIQAGGNPFEERLARDTSWYTSRETCTVVGIAASLGSDRILHSIISAGTRMMRNQQLMRRRDSKLVMQPDAFFRNLEAKENFERTNALKSALIEALLLGNSKQSLDALSAAAVLYEHGAELTEKDTKALHDRLLSGKLSSATSPCLSRSFVGTYRHSDGDLRDSKMSNLIDVEYDRSLLEFWSRCLLTMPWVITDVDKSRCSCPWMNERSQRISEVEVENCHLRKDVHLITSDGMKYFVHSSIISQKSEKLASAIRFAQMNNEKSKMGAIVAVPVAIPSQVCKLMIQHIYHGSIFCDWPNVHEDVLCRFLLELMLVAEEYLCQSLLQECEMRLLSSDPKSCFCFSCCGAVRVRPSTKGRCTAECMYFADGYSALLKGSTVLDVFSATEYISGGSYSIRVVNSSLAAIKCVPSKKLWSTHDKGDGEAARKEGWIASASMVSVKDLVNVTMLREFSNVVQSSAFQQSADLNEGVDGKCSLLQMCLDELQTNAILADADVTPRDAGRESSRHFCTSIG